jgi:AraC-like DNA-binding protein
LEWAIAHLNEPLSLGQLAARAGMSLRSFTRHFKKKTGTTFTQWLAGLFDLACQLPQTVQERSRVSCAVLEGVLHANF